MTRVRLWHILLLLTVAVATVSFFVSYLGARDTVPAVAAATHTGPTAPISGIVTGTQGQLTVQTRDGNTLSLDIPPDQPLLASIPATRADLAIGDTVIIAIDRTNYGGQAIRAIIRLPEAPGGQQ